MRFFTLIIDLLVIAFFVTAFYRLSTQKSDTEIEKNRQKIDRTGHSFDKLNDTFD